MFSISSKNLDRSSLALSRGNFETSNAELWRCVEDLRRRREEIHRQLLQEEEDAAKIQRELAILTERLQRINASIDRKNQARREYDRTIQETEAAYKKILESSHTLLTVLRRETANLATRGGDEDLA